MLMGSHSCRPIELCEWSVLVDKKARTTNIVSSLKKPTRNLKVTLQSVSNSHDTLLTEGHRVVCTTKS